MENFTSGSIMTRRPKQSSTTATSSRTSSHARKIRRVLWIRISSGRYLIYKKKVIADILQSEEEKRTLEVAPRSVDPIQQTVATALQSYLNHPDVDRRTAIELIRFLNQPMLRIQVQKLRQTYRQFQNKNEIKTLLSAIDELRKASGGEEVTREAAGKSR
jgi:hypothetical protein